MTTVHASSGAQPINTFAENNANSMSTDDLLILFAQASSANDDSQNVIKTRMENAIQTKGDVGKVQQDIQGLASNGGNAADPNCPLKADLQTAIDNAKDPQVKDQLQKAYDTYFNNTDAAHADNTLSPDECKQLGTTLDSITSGIDDNNQMDTLKMKAMNDKFTQVTDIVKDIMDSTQKNFETINQNSV